MEDFDILVLANLPPDMVRQADKLIGTLDDAQMDVFCRACTFIGSYPNVDLDEAKALVFLLVHTSLGRNGLCDLFIATLKKMKKQIKFNTYAVGWRESPQEKAMRERWEYLRANIKTNPDTTFVDYEGREWTVKGY